MEQVIQQLPVKRRIKAGLAWSGCGSWLELLNAALVGHAAPQFARVAGKGVIIDGDEVIELHLERLAARQQPDGGWPIFWETVGPGAELEWRGWLTYEAIRTLNAYGALDWR